MSEVAAPAPSAPTAEPAAVAPVPVAPAASPSAEAPEKSAAQTDNPSPPTGEKPASDADKTERARHRRQLSTAYRKEAEARAKAEFFEKQFNELKTKGQPSDDPNEPKLENFKDISEWGDALSKYRSNKALTDHQTKQRSDAQKQSTAQMLQAWEERAERGASKYDDFEEVVGHLQPTTPWSIGVMRVENGDEVAYHLGKNDAEAVRIAKLDPVSQFIEIGRLSAKLAAEPPKAKTPSKAPPPITPLSGTSPADASQPSSQDDMATWFKKRQQQVHGVRR